MSIDHIAGVDLSPGNTAIVGLSRHQPAPRFTLVTTPALPRGAPPTAKLDRIRTIRGGVLLPLLGVDLIVLEDLSYASAGSSTRDLAGLWWTTYDALVGLGHDIAVVSPNTLKKWATGAGNASKLKVALAIARRWPDIDLGSDDEADALALASIGAQHAGYLPWTPTQNQTREHDRITWPTMAVAA